VLTLILMGKQERRRKSALFAAGRCRRRIKHLYEEAIEIVLLHVQARRAPKVDCIQ